MMKHYVIIGAITWMAISYGGERSIQIKYSPQELVAYSPPHTSIPDKIGLEDILAAKRRGLSSSIDSSSEVAAAMEDFCKKHPEDAQKIVPYVRKKNMQSCSDLGKTPDEQA